MAGSESLKLELEAATDGDPDHSLAGWHRGTSESDLDHDLNDGRHRRCSLPACAKECTECGRTWPYGGRPTLARCRTTSNPGPGPGRSPPGMGAARP
jgi:hypothetical protein